MSMKNSYADIVNPHIGRIGHLLQATRPTVMRPHSMATVMPIYTPGVTDNYLAETIHGFPVGMSAFMVDARSSQESKPRIAAGYDHDRECMKCYKGDVLLEESEVRVEYTASDHALYYKITFPANTWNTLSFITKAQLGRAGGFLMGSSGKDISSKLDISADGEVLTGSVGDVVKGSFYMELSEKASGVENRDYGVLLNFDPQSTPRILEIKAGISYIDAAQARLNLDTELKGKNFDQTVEETRDAWNKALGTVEVTGGSHDDQVMFYTALYRMMNRMQNISECGGRYFSGYDNQIHEDDGHGFYINDGIWDTYRCAHPLQLILQEKRQQDIVRSYLKQYQQSGWLPSFPHLPGNQHVMLGKHATAMITDTWNKGYKNFDIELAYEAMLKNADEATKMPWTGGGLSDYDHCYFEKGFFPALPEGEKETLPSHDFERRQCVAVTLETCYDDWCLAQIAKELGKTEDYERLIKRSENYRNVYNSDTGFMSPKLADGSWVSDFDPKLSGGQGARAYFAECNSWTYTWHVQHKIDGLIELMGGEEAFCDRLDQLFREQYDTSKFHFLGQLPDMTGLIGQFCMGNEPSFHIPYLYNHSGQAWKTQRRLREILRLWFHNHPLGICGDEDGGAMSAWYVFTAMGFYPTCPGKPEYDIGSPIFDEVRIHMENGKTFTIKTTNQNPKHKYIQNAKLNGKEYSSSKLMHKDLYAGGILEFEMGLKPNTAWG